MGDIHHPGWVYQLAPAGAFHLVATFNGTDGGGSTGGVLFKLTLPH